MRKVAAAVLSAALAIGPFAPGIAEELSLEGKTIGVTVIGTSHHWDYMAFRGQIETLERLDGRVIAYDAYHNDKTQIAHIRDLISPTGSAWVRPSTWRATSPAGRCLR